MAEYAWLVEEVRKNAGNIDKNSRWIAIDRAITTMPDDFWIKPFLEAHRAEARGMLLEEYNEAEQMELFRRDGIEEGREEGRRAALLESLQRLVQLKGMELQEAMDILGIPAEEQPYYVGLCADKNQ